MGANVIDIFWLIGLSAEPSQLAVREVETQPHGPSEMVFSRHFH